VVWVLLFTANRHLLIYRKLIEPYRVYAEGILEWIALDKLPTYAKEVLWSLIYRKMKGKRGNTMLLPWEVERLVSLIKDVNNGEVLDVSAPTELDFNYVVNGPSAVYCDVYLDGAIIAQNIYSEPGVIKTVTYTVDSNGEHTWYVECNGESAYATFYLSGWLSDYNYRKQILIYDQSGSDLYDYQVRIVLDDTTITDFWTSVKPDCSDIRFTKSDGITEIPYWIEKCEVGNHKIIVYVKVPYIPANDKSVIYMYYGKSDATCIGQRTDPQTGITYCSGDGSATFEFFDDFNDGSYSDKWIGLGSPKPEEWGSYFDPNGDTWCSSGALSKQTFNISNGFDMLVYAIREPKNAYWHAWEWSTGIGVSRGQIPYYQWPCNTGTEQEVYSDYFAIYIFQEDWGSVNAYKIYYVIRDSGSTIGYNDFKWHTYEGKIFPNRYVELYQDYSLKYSSFSSSTSNNVHISLRGRSAWDRGTKADWVAVRKFADPEPYVEIIN